MKNIMLLTDILGLGIKSILTLCHDIRLYIVFWVRFWISWYGLSVVFSCFLKAAFKVEWCNFLNLPDRSTCTDSCLYLLSCYIHITHEYFFFPPNLCSAFEEISKYQDMRHVLWHGLKIVWYFQAWHASVYWMDSFKPNIVMAIYHLTVTHADFLVIHRLQRTNRSPGPGPQPAGRNSPGNAVTSMVGIHFILPAAIALSCLLDSS